MKRVQERQDAVNISAALARTVAGDAAEAGRLRSDVALTRTEAGDLFSALVVQLFRAHGLVVAAGDALSRPAGQTTARWQVLAAIEHAPTTVAAIARAMALTRQSVQRVADLLAEDGLAVYEENPAHRRAKLLGLTPHGRDALAIIQSGQRVWADAIGTDVGADDLQQAGELLTRVLAAVEKHQPDGLASGAADSS